MTRRKPQQKKSSRKISETFLRFAEPLLTPLGADASQAEMEQALMIAWTVWNAVVFDAADRGSKWIDQLRARADHNPSVLFVVEQLVSRKGHLFGNDHRLIGEYRIYRHDGEWRLRAEARRPSPRSSTPGSQTSII